MCHCMLKNDYKKYQNLMKAPISLWFHRDHEFYVHEKDPSSLIATRVDFKENVQINMLNCASAINPVIPNLVCLFCFVLHCV